MLDNIAQEKALKDLQVTIEEMSTPESGAEVIAYLEHVTENATREHDAVLKRSQVLAGIRLFPPPE
jgi:hypothetical protein